MRTMFDPDLNHEILERLNKLQPSSKPHWGKLSIERMLAHLNLSMQVNRGEFSLHKSMLGFFLKGISRRILLGEKPFPKNLPTDKKLLTNERPDFFLEKAKVQAGVKLYIEKGRALISANPHNILGKITPEESAFITYKHFDHHFRQFGV